LNPESLNANTFTKEQESVMKISGESHVVPRRQEVDTRHSGKSYIHFIFLSLFISWTLRIALNNLLRIKDKCYLTRSFAYFFSFFFACHYTYTLYTPF